MISNKKKEKTEICLKFVLQSGKRNELDLQNYNFACLLNKKYTLAPKSAQLSEASTFDVISGGCMPVSELTIQPVFQLSRLLFTYSVEILHSIDRPEVCATITYMLIAEYLK